MKKNKKTKKQLSPVEVAIKRADKHADKLYQNVAFYGLKDYSTREEWLQEIINVFEIEMTSARKVFCQLFLTKSMAGFDELPFDTLIENTNYYSQYGFRCGAIVKGAQKDLKTLNKPARKKKIRDYEAEDREYEMSLA